MYLRKTNCIFLVSPELQTQDSWGLRMTGRILRLYMKYIIFLMCMILLGNSIPAYCQRVVYDYDMQLTELDSTQYKLEDQSYNFILGLGFKTILICKIYHYTSIDKYYVYGFIADHRYDNPLDSPFYNASIKVMKDVNVLYTTYTTQNGIFSFTLNKGEIARFNEDEGYYTDLIINDNKRQ